MREQEALRHPAASGVRPRIFTESVLFTRGTAGTRSGHTPPTMLGALYLMVLFVLWMLNLADLVLTMHWTGDVGWAAEGNAIMRHVAHLFGSTGFAVYKVLLMSFVVLALWWLYLRFESDSARARRVWQMRALESMRLAAVLLTLGLLAFYTWVIWNNLHVAGLL